MQGIPEHGHDAVMLGEVLRGLGLGEGNAEIGPPKNAARVMMDCTIGRGGHAAQIARMLAAAGGGMLIGLDVDPENLKYARQRIEAALAIPEVGAPNSQTAAVALRTFQANFGEVEDVLEAVGIQSVDGLLADFGVSTNQLLDGRHGLSFGGEEALDMRLDPRIKKRAADLLAELDEHALAEILQTYAQERFARRIARKIALTRATEPIKTTGQLARLVRSVVPHKWGQIDPATRTFQALRMAVNNEPEAITELLAALPGIMNPGGRAVFLSFHSGEDRLVKQALRGWEERGIAKALAKKPLEPADSEMHTNPRARSAKLRSVEFHSAK